MSANVPGAERLNGDAKCRRALRLGQAELRPNLSQGRGGFSHRSRRRSVQESDSRPRKCPSGCGLAWPLTLTAARTTSSFESATERACRTPAAHLRPNVNLPATVADWHILITHEPYNTGSSPGTKTHPSRESQPRLLRHRGHHSPVGLRAGGRDARHVRHAHSHRRDTGTDRGGHHSAWRHRRDRHSLGQRASRVRSGRDGTPCGRVGDLRRYPRDALPGRGA